MTSREPNRIGEPTHAGAEGQAPAPVTGPYHGPSLSDHLRLIGSLAGTTDKRGHQNQRDAVAYVESITSDMLAALTAIASLEPKTKADNIGLLKRARHIAKCALNAAQFRPHM